MNIPLRFNLIGDRPPTPRRLWWLLQLTLGLVFLGGGQVQAAAAGPLVVFLVRHAEKMDESFDSDLSSEGIERAAALSRVLRDARIEHIHSSDFIRTRRTAEPTARLLNLEVQLYDRLKSAALVSKLRQSGGRHLVVAHSSTIPGLVRLLGGDPGPAFEEHSEFDRLTIVTVDEAGKSTTLHLRYGRAGPDPDTPRQSGKAKP